MKELEENTIEQIRTLLNYLEQTDLLKNKDILRCLDVIAREYGGKVVDENWNKLNNSGSEVIPQAEVFISRSLTQF